MISLIYSLFVTGFGVMDGKEFGLGGFLLFCLFGKSLVP